MANKRVVTIYIQSDGKEVRETTKDIERLSNGLHDLDVRQAKEAQETLKGLGHVDLNGTIKDAQELKKTLSGIDDSQLKEAQKATKELGSDAEKTGNTYRDAAGRMRDANGKFVTSAKEAKNTVDKLGNGVRNASADFGKLAEKANAAGEKIKNTGQSVRDFGTKLTAGATIPIIGFGVAAVKSFADVELAVARISTIKPEIDTTRVREALNDMSTRVPQTADALGEGLYNIFSSINVSQVEGLKLLEGFSKGATAAETDAKTFGTAVLGVMNAYKLSVEDAAHVSDVFFNTVNLGVVNGQELANELGSVTTAAKQAGVSFDELGALIVGVTKEGGSASENINRLNNFLQKLPTSGADIKKLLNVDVKDGDKFRPVIDVLTDFKASYDKLSQTKQAEVLQKIFPDAQAREGAAKLLSQLDAVKEALEVNKTTSGAAEAAYQKISATASVQFTLLKNTSIAILSELGSAILPVLQPLIIWLAQNLVPAVKQAVEVFKTWSPQMQTTAVAVAAFIAAIGPAVIVIGTVIDVIGTLIGAIASIGITPLVSLVAVLAAVGVAAYALYQAWTQNIGGIQEKAAEVFNNLKTIIEPAVQEVSEFVQKSFADVIAWVNTNLPTLVEAALNVVKWLEKLWAEHGEEIKSIVSSAWNIVKTIITGIGAQIGNIILLVANIINGNWSGAWENFKAIVQTGINASLAILKSLGNIVYQILKAIVVRIYNIGADFLEVAYQIGKNLLQGLLNGISEGATAVYEKARGIISNIISIWESIPKIQSPSKVTTEIGQFLAEGLAVGMQNKAERVTSVAKKLALDVIKELKEAVKEFEKLAGASSENVQGIQKADELKQAANDLREIIKLRKELNVHQDLPLPKDISGVNSELSFLKYRKDNPNDAVSILEQVQERQVKETAEEKAKLKLIQDREDAIRQAGEVNLLNLQKEIQLVGVTDEMEKIRIQNAIDLKKLRLDLANDGFEQDEIDNLVKITELEQGRLLELQKIAIVRKEILEASNLGKDLNEKLFSLQNGGRELSEYEKTLKRLNEDFKDISPQQREQILNTAAQVDAQKKFNEEYKKTYEVVRGALDILTEKGTSFGEKMKSIFGNVFNSFKKMILDMTAQMITSKLFGGSNVSGNNTGGSSNSGGSFGSILNRIFGGGSSGTTPPFAANNFAGSSSIKSISDIQNLVNTGSSLSTEGTLESTIFNRDGSSFSLDSIITNSSTSGSPGNNVSAYTKLKQLVGKGGMFGEEGFGFNSGTIQGIGGIMGLAGDLIGGKVGGVLSGASMGIGIASSLSTILGISALGGPIGLIAGAVIGGLVTLLSNPQRRKDETFRNDLMLATLKDLNAIKSEMDAAKPGINVKGLLDQAKEISAKYFQQANTIKDSKTKKIAIKDGNERVGSFPLNSAYPSALLNQIFAASETAQTKEQMRAFGDERDKRILPMFASGVFMDNAFASQYGDFKRRNGLLPGTFTGRDTLPSMLAMGEMVLNPMQQMNVIRNAGFDAFDGAGIPNYRPKKQVQGFAEGVNLNSNSPSFSSFPSSNSKAKQPILLTLVLNNSGMVESDIEDIVFDSLDDTEFQVKLLKTVNKVRSRE